MDDDFGDRMKAYEAVETGRRFDVSLPVYARIDGRSFSRFTRGMSRPYDEHMQRAMIETARHLVDATHALIGYVQSDEISLIWEAASPESDIFFSGKTMKMASVLASMAAAKFARVCPEGYEDRLPHFDARVIQMPDRVEASNMLLWRAMDARKNAIQAVAQSVFSPRQLHGRGQRAMIEMLAGEGVSFEDYPTSFKRGVFLRRVSAPRHLTPDELERIPEKHRPAGPVTRSSVIDIEMPRFDRVVNRMGVIFGAETPEDTADADNRRIEQEEAQHQEEMRQIEEREMEEHFRKHPHG